MKNMYAILHFSDRYIKQGMSWIDLDFYYPETYQIKLIFKYFESLKTKLFATTMFNMKN